MRRAGRIPANLENLGSGDQVYLVRSNFYAWLSLVILLNAQ